MTFSLVTPFLKPSAVLISRSYYLKITVFYPSLKFPFPKRSLPFLKFNLYSEAMLFAIEKLSKIK